MKTIEWKSIEFKEMTSGSEKQIEWARKLRRESLSFAVSYYSDIQDEMLAAEGILRDGDLDIIEKAIRALALKDSAIWWINNRGYASSIMFGIVAEEAKEVCSRHRQAGFFHP